MSKPKRQGDWWETFLYFGLLILFITFIFQLLKLWNAGSASVSNGFASIGQAIANTATAAENFLTGLVTAPFSAIGNVFNLFPTLLNLLTSFVSGVVFSGSFLTAIPAFFGSLFSDLFGSLSTPGAVDTGNGSAAPGTSTGDSSILTDPGNFGGATILTNGGVVGEGFTATANN